MPYNWWARCRKLLYMVIFLIHQQKKRGKVKRALILALGISNFKMISLSFIFHHCFMLSMPKTFSKCFKFNGQS